MTLRTLFVIFCVALIVRLGMIVVAPPEALTSYWMGFDGEVYVTLADNLINGHGFSRFTEPPYFPDALKTPLYPLMLAGVYLLFGNFVSIVYVQALMGSLIPIFGYLIARFFVSDWRILFGLTLFLALEPHLAFATTFFGTEGISVFLIAFGLYETLLALRLASWRHALFAGLIFGIVTLARPITLYLPIPLLVIFVYEGLRSGKFRTYMVAFGVFAVAFMLVLSPWLVRNYATFNTFGLSLASSYNLYTRFAATVVAIDTDNDFYTSYQYLLDELSVRGHINHPPPVKEIEIETFSFAPILEREARRVLSEHPRALLIYLATAPFSVLTQTNLLGYASSLYPFEYARPSFSPTLYVSQHGIVAFAKAIFPYLTGPYIVPYVVRAFYVLFFIFACFGAWLLFRRGERSAAVLLFGFIIYLTVLTSVAGAQLSDRHRAPFLIAEAVLATIALERLVKRREGILAT